MPRSMFWRRERDSNPRDAINAYTISNRAPSTSSAISPTEQQCLLYQLFLLRQALILNLLYFLYFPPVLKKGWRAAAIPLTGMVWSVTLPGPVTTVLNNPSPPKRTFLTPFTV